MLSGWWVNTVLAEFGPAGLLSWTVVVFGSIVLHELAHGWVAIRLGDDTPRLTGHMTWNPVVHLGTMSMLIFAMFGIAWGAMPIDPTKLRGRHADAVVTIAGPLMNFMLALVSGIALGVWRGAAISWGVKEPMYGNAETFFWFGAVLNVALALFNMLPVLPLDGGHVVASFWRGYVRIAMSEHGRWLMLGLFLVAFWFGSGLIFGAAIFSADILSYGVEAIVKTIVHGSP